MKKEFIDLARYRLKKAKDTLSDSKKYIERATLESTINRIYYSMFYAVNGLLITMGLSSCDILTAINYRASRWGFGSCFTKSTCSAAVVLSTGFNSDVSHPIRKKHITNYKQNQ